VHDVPVWDPRRATFGIHQRDQYLTFGFVPELPDGDPLSLLSQWSRPPRRNKRSVSERALVHEGALALTAAVEESVLSTPGGGDQVVFLSGGLDSRAILGALLDAYDSGEILAATFGTPGEQDFDFAREVARTAGVRHEALESFSVDWTTDGLVESVLAREVPLPHPFGQRYLSYRLHERIGRSNTFWDGLCGDVTGGVATQIEMLTFRGMRHERGFCASTSSRTPTSTRQRTFGLSRYYLRRRSSAASCSPIRTNSSWVFGRRAGRERGHCVATPFAPPF